MDRSKVQEKCRGLKRFWAPRNAKMKEWYKLIQMVDELKRDKMESFVGNDPRSMYNLILHMLDTKIPHKVPSDEVDISILPLVAELEVMLGIAWADNHKRYRKTGRQSLIRDVVGLLLATGWYSVFSVVSDDGSRTFIDAWNPAQVFPMWSDNGLAECAHIFTVTPFAAKRMVLRNSWNIDTNRITHDLPVYDYWWVDEWERVWNSIILGDDLVKDASTRFKQIPIFTAPVGGLPDMGIIMEDKDNWKKEIGQSTLATNENIYKSWNRWWTFSTQLLRDTAQPRIFERSASGKPIVKPEEVFKRGAVFRGGPQDSVSYLTPPPIPLEIRSAQLDMEAMMQRGGVSWSMTGTAMAGMTAYVMSQIAASANQVIKPFHQAIVNLVSDIDNFWVSDIRQTGARPYGYKLPPEIDESVEVTADYEVKIPGDLIQRATTARMLNPDFEVSYIKVIQELFPEIKNPIEEKSRIRREKAEAHPVNAIIALVEYFKNIAEILRQSNDLEGARLYTKAAAVAEATLDASVAATMGGQQQIGTRAEGAPTSLTAPPGGM